LWVERYDGLGNGDDVARNLVVSPDGSRVFVAGDSVGSSGDRDYGTVAYDASTGTQLWGMAYDGPGKGTDEAFAIGVSPGGSKVFVTGVSPGSSGDDDYATVAYDAVTGSQLWASRYDGPAKQEDQATALSVSPDGDRLFVTGFSQSSSTGLDFATVAYDTGTGARLWVRRYNGPGDVDDKANAIGVGPGGGMIYVTGFGYRTPVGPGDFITVAYDAANGSRLWVRRYNGPAQRGADALALAVSPGGSRVFVTGYTYDSQGYADYATVAYDAATGGMQWARRYKGPAGSDDLAFAVQVSPGGSLVFVTGSSIGSATGYDYGTVAYAASTGVQRWATRYSGPGDGADQALDLAVSPDGTEVFVTGFSVRLTGGEDYGTIAYEASSGVQLWAADYDGTGDAVDEAFAIGTSPDGSKVFVTGESTGSAGNADFATVAYSTS